MTNLSTELARLAEAATPGEWFIVGYGDGDSLVIHYDADNRVCFMATPGSHGAMDRIDADAALIVALRNNLPAIIAALKAAETPLGDVAGLVNEARLDAKAFREHNVYDSEGDPIRLAQNAARLDQYADAIEALTRQLGEAQQHAEALAAVLEEVAGELEAEVEAKRGLVLLRTTERDLLGVRSARAALAAYRSVK